MITLHASSIDELNIIWKKLRTDFQVIESIHLDPKTLQYRMVINQPELTRMLRGVAEKVLDRLDIYADKSLDRVITLKQFNERMESKADNYQSLEPLAKIWEVISMTDRKAVFAFLKSELGGEVSEMDDDELIEIKN